MARLARYNIEGYPQHIIQRGNNLENIFLHDKDYQFFLDCLYEAVKSNDVALHAFVLMPNHVHILATQKQLNGISKTMQSIGRRYVRYFNLNYQREGSLWESRYRATILDSKQYLLKCMRYIELNPVRLKLVKSPEDHLWSSFIGNTGVKKNKNIVPHKQFKKLADTKKERQAAYRLLFETAINAADLQTIRESTHKGWALGDARFCAKVEQLSGRRATPKTSIRS